MHKLKKKVMICVFKKGRRLNVSRVTVELHTRLHYDVAGIAKIMWNKMK
jgi:hypothetical protein